MEYTQCLMDEWLSTVRRDLVEDCVDTGAIAVCSIQGGDCPLPIAWTWAVQIGLEEEDCQVVLTEENQNLQMVEQEADEELVDAAEP